MTSFELTALALRIIGIWVWMTALEVLAYASTGTPPRGLVLGGAYVVLGAVLVFGNRWIAKKTTDAVGISAPGQRGSASEHADVGQIEAVSYSVLGLVLVLRGVGHLAAQWLWGSPHLRFSGLILVGLGGLLFTGSRGLREIGERIRRPGLEAHPAAQSTPHPLQVVAFSVVGLYLAITGAASLASLTAYGSGSRIEDGVRTALGLALFFGGARLARFWSRLQGASPAESRERERASTEQENRAPEPPLRPGAR